MPLHALGVGLGFVRQSCGNRLVVGPRRTISTKLANSHQQRPDRSSRRLLMDACLTSKRLMYLTVSSFIRAMFPAPLRAPACGTRFDVLSATARYSSVSARPPSWRRARLVVAKARSWRVFDRFVRSEQQKVHPPPPSRKRHSSNSSSLLSSTTAKN